MKYNLFSNLSDIEKSKYSLMLQFYYVLLRCDEKYFIEVNEYGSESMSVSWIHSIQSALEKFGLGPSFYPQGSISANRNYYETLKNFCGGRFPDNTEFNYLISSLKNFLYLRRDDSYPSGSLLFGSFFNVERDSDNRDPQVYRKVKYNLRHTGTALWILIEESENRISKQLENSIRAFFINLEKYLSYENDWKKDNLKSLTLSSAINTCKALIKHSKDSELIDQSRSIKNKCEEAIFRNDCIEESTTDELNWIFPDPKTNQLGKYEYYLSGFSLAQLPEMVIDERIQGIVKGMINNKVDSLFGEGIPIHRRNYFSTQKKALPDFGATSIVLFILWYSLENNLGGDDWLNYCQENINWLLEFCLNTYDKPEYHQLPILENSSKILLLPNYNPEIIFNKDIERFISELKAAIYSEMSDPNRKLKKSLSKIKSPEGLEHVKDFILTWEISKHYKNQKKWSFLANAAWGKIGEFCGGFLRATIN